MNNDMTDAMFKE